MKIKKVITTILVLIVAFGMAAGYIFTGFAPRQLPQEPAPSDFQGPTSQPSVKGPTAPPTIQ